MRMNVNMRKKARAYQGSGERIDSEHVETSMNVEDDRLSSLPDELIHRILSFVDITDAIETSVLSSRWRFTWTSMPYLNFSSKKFSTLPEFAKFVNHVLSRRNNLAEVYSMNFSFRGKSSQVFVKKILNYAISHNIQELNLLCMPAENIEFPLSLLSSPSIKQLSLRKQNPHSYFTTLPSTWELPELTTLDLHSVELCDDNPDECISIFSKCANLKTLTLKYFSIKGSNDLRIVHPQLSSLTLENSRQHVKVVKVDAPQLKNLTIRCDDADLVISAPSLVSLICKSFHHLNLATDGFHSLEKADICVTYPNKADARQIFCLLQVLHNVKFLTLNLEIAELLSSSGILFRHHTSPFVKLKSLKIHPDRVHVRDLAPEKVVVSTELKKYLLDSSPGCTFTLVLREEIITESLIAEVGTVLEKLKDVTDTNKTHLERVKAAVGTYTSNSKTEQKNGQGKMEQIKSFWENFGEQFELRRKNACDIFSQLESIEESMIKLPESYRTKIQPFFANLCAEAHITTTKIIDCMKNDCDENRSRLSLCFDELATTLPS